MPYISFEHLLGPRFRGKRRIRTASLPRCRGGNKNVNSCLNGRCCWIWWRVQAGLREGVWAREGFLEVVNNLGAEPWRTPRNSGCCWLRKQLWVNKRKAPLLPRGDSCRAHSLAGQMWAGFDTYSPSQLGSLVMSATCAAFQEPLREAVCLSFLGLL